MAKNTNGKALRSALAAAECPECGGRVREADVRVTVLVSVRDGGRTVFVGSTDMDRVDVQVFCGRCDQWHDLPSCETRMQEAADRLVIGLVRNGEED